VYGLAARADAPIAHLVARITLLTDFGTQDGYVGVMKGVIATIFPGVTIDDVSHSIEPGDLTGAGRVLARYWKRYPPGSTHVVVVDPGVGTERRAIAVEAEGRFIVAPDNGVVSRVLDLCQDASIVSLENPEFLLVTRSSTFHGRDVFAPAAAFLASGVHLCRLGPAVAQPVRIEEPASIVEAGVMVGQVVALDRFGNLLTNLAGSSVTEGSGVEVDGRTVQVVSSYQDIPPESVGAIVNSDGVVEVAARDTPAAAILNAGLGTPVRIPDPVELPDL